MKLACRLFGHKYRDSFTGSYWKKWYRFCLRCGENAPDDIQKLAEEEAREISRRLER